MSPEGNLMMDVIQMGGSLSYISLVWVGFHGMFPLIWITFSAHHLDMGPVFISIVTG